MEGSRWRGLGGGTYVKGTRWSVESGRRVWGTLGTQLPRYTYEPLQTFSCHIDLIGSHGSVRSVPTVPWKIISVRFTTVRFHSVRFHTVQVPPVPRLGSQPPCHICGRGASSVAVQNAKIDRVVSVVRHSQGRARFPLHDGASNRRWGPV